MTTPTIRRSITSAPPLPAELEDLLRRLRLPHIRRHAPEVVDTISCPIGLPALTGKQPATIALSVAADLLSRLR